MSTSRPLESLVADVLRYPLTVLVLWTHCVIMREDVPILDLSAPQLHQAFEQFVRGFGPVCVGFFAIVSGYYFYLKARDFSMAYYEGAVRKRFTSLVVPMLLWNALAIAALWVKVQVATAVDFTPGIVPEEVAWLGNMGLGSLFFNPVDHPLWYVRELVYLSLLSPLVFLALRYLKGWWLLVLVAARYFDLPYWWPADLGISFYFSLGAWLALEGRTILTLVPRRWYCKLLLVLLLFFYGYVMWLLPGTKVYGLLRFVTQSAWIVAFVWWAESLTLSARSGVGLRSRIFDFLMSWGSASFFIYALHAILWINLFRGLLYTTALADYSAGPSIIFVLTALLTTLACMLCYRLMKRFAPRPLALLMGDR